MRCAVVCVLVVCSMAHFAGAQAITERDPQRAREIARQREWWVRRVDKLGRVAELQAIVRGMPRYLMTHNRDAADSVSTDECWSGGWGGLNLTGSGVTLGVWDGGAVWVLHDEFEGRVTIKDGSGFDDGSIHATHVGGTMVAAGLWPGGSGIPAGSSKGMAGKALLHSYNWDFDLTEMNTAAAAGLRTSNHSYGYVTGWHNAGDWYWFGDVRVSKVEDYRFGYYDEIAQAFDQVAFDNPLYLFVKSAGNDRNDNGPEAGGIHWVLDPNSWMWVESTETRNPDGPYDCIEGGGIAKNGLTVGAVNDVIGGYTGAGGVVMTDFSSWGPADDGRIKPDLVANGYQLFSPIWYYDEPGWYARMSGTSMAAPNATGSLALLIEHWRTTHQGASDMRSATLKGLVIHTADECGAWPGPDYSFGWGLMNTLKAAQAISFDLQQPLAISELVLDANNPVFSASVASMGTGEDLRVTICWTDPPGTPPGTDPNSIVLDDPTRMLVNDLDLRLSTADGTTYFPWVLDVAQPSAPATYGDNKTDNVEQVVVPQANAGRYFISVSHKGTLSGSSQPFSLIVTGIAPVDCNNNGIPDEQEVAANPALDCNGDGVPDSCEMGLVPTVTTPPASTTACIGATATFTVAAKGAIPLTYQWYKDGQPLAGATSATLTITNVTAADVGSYAVTVTSPCGSVTSTAATLTTQQTLVLTHPVSQVVTAGDPVLFEAKGGGPEPITYQWRKDGQPIAGATYSQYGIAPVLGQHAGTYDVVVTTGCGSLISNPAVLTVTLAAPGLLAPGNRAEAVSIDADLKWTSVFGADTYDVYFGTMSPPPLVGSTDKLTWALPQLDYSTTYYWMILARGGAMSSASATWSFTTHRSPPAAPADPCPADKATDVPVNVELTWAGAAGAEVYQVLIGQDAELKDARFAGSTLSQRFSWAKLAPNTSYYWRVVAKNEIGATTGPIWSFTTGSQVALPTDQQPQEPATQTPTTPSDQQPAADANAPTGADSELGAPTGSALCPATGAGMVAATLLALRGARPRARRPA